MREICVSKSIGLALQLGGKFTVFAFFYFVFGGNVPSTKPPRDYLDGRFNGGVFALPVWGGLYLETRAYTWRGLFSEFYSINFIKKREKLLYLLQLTVIKQLHWRKINARQQFIECSFPIFSHFILLLKILVIVRDIQLQTSTNCQRTH